MTDLQVDFVELDAWGRNICRVGGPHGVAHPGRWRVFEQKVIRAIDNGEHTFFAIVDRRRVEVRVHPSNGPHTRPYLETFADGEWLPRLRDFADPLRKTDAT